MRNLIKFFSSWKSIYISRLEKENERLIQEVRHWQNQCLIGMRMPPLPTVLAGESQGVQKPLNMPKIKTMSEQKKRDLQYHDRQWASDVVDNSLELNRAIKEQEKLSNNGVSH